MSALGDYILQRSLGAGPFGEVHLAEHRFIKRPFALKVLPAALSNDPIFIRRLESQVALIASLDHPNILKIHNVSYQDGSYFLVTDPVLDPSGKTVSLDLFLENQGQHLSEEHRQALLRQIADALDYAHQLGIFHGSLKLSNILMVAEEDGFRPMLSDFGLGPILGEGLFLLKICEKISRALLAYSQPEHTVEAALNWVRSFAFLAPEQKKLTDYAVDAKVDAYAFGVLTYFVLTGKIPEGSFDLPSKVLPDYKQNWDLLITRCLQTNPGVRPQKLTFGMDEYLPAPKTVLREMMHLSELEPKLDSIHQMNFEFATKSIKTTEAADQPKPIIKPQEIERPEFEPDPGAIFLRETHVSQYTPKQVAALEVEPILTEMVVIPGGRYMRGSSDGARDEMPRHEVNLKSFALDIHPVTNEQFVRFLQAMGGEKDHNNNDIIRLRDSRIKRSAGKVIIESGYAKHPVVGVTWYGAVAYARWVGKRLPTEAEWEAASSGGNAQFLYPTGSDIERIQANFFSSDTTAVMSYPPNGFGLYDMAGNVYQWCQDWYAYNFYDVSSLEPDCPVGPNQGVYRVLRGGCWKSLKEDMRCSHRHRNNPGAVNGTYGFRCAADVS